MSAPAPQFLAPVSPWVLNDSGRQALEQALAEAEKQLTAPGFKDLPWVERQRRTEDAASLRRQLDLARNEAQLAEGRPDESVASNHQATPTSRQPKGTVERIETVNGKTYLRTYATNGHSDLCIESKELKPGTRFVVE